MAGLSVEYIGDGFDSQINLGRGLGTVKLRFNVKSLYLNFQLNEIRSRRN
jgi:hypothetical protein